MAGSGNLYARAAPLAWLALLALLGVGCSSGTGSAGKPPEGFVSLEELDAGIELDIRYFTRNNFIGRPVEGYFAPACILSRSAADALVRAQQLALSQGFSLKVYDCYRPQRAVNDFMVWASDADDILMQGRFYPEVDKSRLFELGYIASSSGHSRGSTVDLTLVPADSRQPAIDPFANRYDCRGPRALRYPDNSIDMGTGYDCFDARSHTDNRVAGETALRNRQLLRSVMTAAGFANYPMEWWHYTLVDEPYPDQYFDFPVE